MNPTGRRNLVILIIFFISLVSVLAVNSLNNKSGNSINTDNSLSEQVVMEAEEQLGGIQENVGEFAFREMTIPYLRSRNYTSQLGEMVELADYPSYTSYLTNYQSDGLMINGLLTRPKGLMPDNGWPAVVFIHGYIPPSQYRTQERYVDYVNYLASRGLVVFKIDLRGHGSSEGEPGGAYYSSDYIVDTLNARAALATAGFVNHDKIGLWGHSMAGNVVLRAMVVQPDISAGVIWAGAVYSYKDWQEYGLSDNSYRPPSSPSTTRRRRQEMIDTYGEFSDQSPFWQQVAATNFLTDLTGAIQLHHAVDDEIVNVGYSRDLANLLEQSGVTYSYHEYTSGGHNISGNNFGLAMQRTVEFFKQNL